MATSLTPEEIQAAFDAYNDELLRTGKVTKDTAEAFNDAKAGVKNYTYQLNQSLKQLGSSMLDLGTAFKDGKQGASVYNNSIKAGADAIDSFASKFGILGRIIGGLITAGAKYAVAVNEQSDKLFESYQQLSRTGAAGASGMKGVFQSMQDFGYNIEQLGDFGNLIKQNAESLAQFGGTVAQGTQAFTSVAKGIQRTGLQTEFMRMGMTVDNINQGMAGYLRIQTLTGTAQRQTNAQLTQGAAEYIRNLDTLTKITGENAATIQQEREARMNEQRFIAVQTELEDKALQARLAGNEAQAQAFEKQMDNNQRLLDMAPKELRSGLIGAMTGFVGTSKEAEALYRTMPQLFQKVASQSFDAGKTLDIGAQEASGAIRRFRGLGKVGGFEDSFVSMAGANKLRVKALKESYAEQERISNEQQRDQVENLDAATESQVGMRQEQMEVTRAMQTMINKGIVPVTKSMEKLSGAVESVASNTPGSGVETGTAGTGRGAQASGGFFSSLFGGSKAAGAPAGKTANAQKAMAYFIAQGYTPEQAAGLVGNLQAESGANLNTAAVGDSGRAKGIAQFHPDRQANFARFAGKSIEKSTLEEQLAFIAHELKTSESAAGTKLKAAKSAREAAAIIDKFYERSSGEARNQRMVNADALLNGGSVAGAVTSAPTAPSGSFGSLYGVPLGGPNDRYRSTVTGVGPDGTKTGSPSSQSSATTPQAPEDPLISKLDEMISLQKTNNNQNQKLLQVARN